MTGFEADSEELALPAAPATCGTGGGAGDAEGEADTGVEKGNAGEDDIAGADGTGGEEGTGGETGPRLFVQVGHNESVDPVGIMYVFWQPGHCHLILPGTEDICLFHFHQGKFLMATE